MHAAAPKILSSPVRSVRRDVFSLQLVTAVERTPVIVTAASRSSCWEVLHSAGASLQLLRVPNPGVSASRLQRPPPC